jgi:arylsulfatase A-like enzyme
MTGGKAARWVDEDMADVLTSKAVGFIESHRSQPFFLYFCTHDIHVPRVPHPRFAGHSRHGTRGDVIEELDASVGEILAALDRTGLAGNTLVIFTSDNGGVLDDGYQDGSATDTSGHRPNGALRGFKGGLFEGGHRVPFIARWPGRVPVGQSDQLVCHVDLAATCAALLDEKLPGEAAVDSFNILPALLGDKRPVREQLVHHTGGFPGRLAIRSASWKLIEELPATAGQPERKPMLFNLADDPAEERDLAAAEPERVAELAERLATIRKSHRSRPGAP